MAIVVDVREFGEGLEQATDQLLLEIGNELVNQLKVESPVGATGDLQRSWQIFQVKPGVVVVGSNIGYALDVQTGTEPHTPDFDQIQAWARRKLGDESAAGPVYRKIQQEGTDANPYITRAIENTVERFRG